MMNKRILVFGIILVMLALGACKDVQPTETQPSLLGGDESGDIVSNRWDLVGYGKPDELTEALPDTEGFLDFDKDRFSASAGCNSIGGAVIIGPETLQFQEMMVTQMLCLGPVMDQETALLALLSSVRTYRLENGQLILETGSNTPQKGEVIVYKPAQDSALQDVPWQLSGLIEGEALVSTWMDEKITLMLSNGIANGFAGCNQYSGEFQVEGNGIKIGPIGSTKMACESAEVNQHETEFLRAFERVEQYRINRESLELLDGDGKIVMTFVKAQ